MAITDEDADIVEERHFDAWGNVAWIKDDSGNNIDKLTVLDRGYTGHEHLQDVKLIHMNGRLYDPVLRRFLAPDNYVQDPYNTQNFNRYGYVYNNPLSYSDPSGEIAWAAVVPYLIAAVKGAVIAVGVNGIANLINGQPFFQGAGMAALIGGITGGLAHGIGNIATSIGGGFKGALAQAYMHGWMGGFMNSVSGADSLAGFASGVFGSAVGSFGGHVATKNEFNKFWTGVVQIGGGGLAGGTGSILAGGKFWNGFRQGSIGAALNHFAHLIQYKIASRRLISKLEKAIELAREYNVEGRENDYYHDPTKPIFRKIEFNFEEYPTSKGSLSYVTERYNVEGLLTLCNGTEIAFKGILSSSGNDFVQQIEVIGTTAGYGKKFDNAVFFRGSGLVFTMEIPNPTQYKSFYRYLYGWD